MNMKWTRFKYQPVLPLGQDGTVATGSKEHIALSKRAATESIVLLKNENNVLPLKRGAKIALFGKGSADYVKGGGGSGDTKVAYVRNLCEAMTEKQAEGKIEVCEPLNKFYTENVLEQYKSGKTPGRTEEVKIPPELWEEAKDCEIAVVSICGFSCEGEDRKSDPNGGEFYLSSGEKEMLDSVCERFDKVAVVLNIGGIIDFSYFADNSKISAIVLAWQGGMEGASATADILCGDETPSGKLADTIARSLSDYPSTADFLESDDFVNYTEDIFVGYRYFETIPGQRRKVVYPFGFGLSYTNFALRVLKAEENGGVISIEIEVENVSDYAGKEVVQVYTETIASAFDTPKRELRAFKKTRALSPKEKEKILLSFRVDELAVYDEKNASYVLPQGVVNVYVGNSVRNAEKVYSYENERAKTVKRLKNRCVPRKLPRKLKSDGSYEALPVEAYDALPDLSGYPHGNSWVAEYILPNQTESRRAEGAFSLEDVLSEKITLDEFVDSLSDDEFITLVGGCHNRGVADTRGIGGLDHRDIPAIMTADGPAGLRLKLDRGVKTTAWPIATALACTWNEEIVFEVGKAAAVEVEENNLGVWLAPAINIHRNPLCGRNFEYYSEDPLLTGKLASAMIRGIQTQNVAACVKHFCCNNKETNRCASDSIVGERALREIYLKAFEIVVRESGVRTVMTAYNKLNGRYTSENKDLISGVLREEWGFDGLVISDWGNWAEQYREIIAGNNVKMPFGTPKRLQKALEDGYITREDLTENVKEIIRFILKFD